MKSDPIRPSPPRSVVRLAATLLTALSLTAMTSACRSSRAQLLQSSQSQVQLRSIQSRAFDTTDALGTLRAVMATLQDLGFVIDNADADLGTVSATKLDRYALRMTVSVRPRGETQLLVRANAQLNLREVTDPQPYQQFFDALSKSLFLAAQQVE